MLQIEMDVNSVLQNTRQYFQGIPSSSPASGELAPGPSVGYNSPPVSSTATSATNPYPYQPSYSQGSWNAAASSSATSPFNAPNAVHYSSASPSPVVTAVNNTPYPRNYSPAVAGSAAYHFYEKAGRSAKALPPTSASAFVPQPTYTAPSITR